MDIQHNQADSELVSRKKLIDTMPLKRFVQAKEVEENKTATTSKKKNYELTPLSGSKIKESYLSIVGNDALQSFDNKDKTNRKPKVSSSKIKKSKHEVLLNVNEIMKAVEINNVAKVLEYINTDKEFVLNVKDQYGWTALMCACCAGSKDVVELLLKYEANVNQTDRKGNTCISLAQSKGHKNVIKLLNDHFNKSKNDNKLCRTNSLNINNGETSTSFYCEICKETILEQSKSHLTSMVHLFNSSKKSGIPTSYGIPEHNVGFQMLLKTGWDREKGLGPEGSGHKFPPKTVLKQDRTGLGAKEYTARVTHSPQSVANDRAERQRTLNRRERLRNELKNKRKEREIRRMLD